VALSAGGFAVTLLASPALLPALLRKERFDLVLVGDASPVVGGKALFEMARGVQQDLPLALLSDRTGAGLAAQVAEFGARGSVRRTQDPAGLCREAAARIEGTAVDSHEVGLRVSQPTVRLVLEQYQRKVGCEPFDLPAEGCVEELVRRRPLAALLELDASPSSGDACCRLIKQHPLACETPVALLASDASEAHAVRCWRAGADDCLPLPMSAAALAAKVAALRAARASARAGRAPQRHAVLLCVGSREQALASLLADNGFQVVKARAGSDAADLMTRAEPRLVATVLDLALAGSDPEGLASGLAGESGRPVLLVRDGPLPAGDPAPGPVLDLQQPLETVVNRLNRALAGRIRNPGMTRVPFFSRVDFRLAGERAWQPGFAHDLSLVGIFVRTLSPLPRGTALELEIEYEGRRQPGRGLVAWKNPFGERRSYAYPPGMGVHLSGLSAELARHVYRLAGSEPRASLPEALEG